MTNLRCIATTGRPPGCESAGQKLSSEAIAAEPDLRRCPSGHRGDEAETSPCDAPHVAGSESAPLSKCLRDSEDRSKARTYLWWSWLGTPPRDAHRRQADRASMLQPGTELRACARCSKRGTRAKWSVRSIRMLPLTAAFASHVIAALSRRSPLQKRTTADGRPASASAWSATNARGQSQQQPRFEATADR